MQKIIQQQVLERLQYLSDYQYDCGNLETTLDITAENQQLMQEYNAWIRAIEKSGQYSRHGYLLMEQGEDYIYGNEIGMIEFLIEQVKKSMEKEKI